MLVVIIILIISSITHLVVAILSNSVWKYLPVKISSKLIHWFLYATNFYEICFPTDRRASHDFLVSKL